MRRSSIDASQIPAAEVRNLSNTFLSAVMRYYADPEHIKAFEDWQRRRNQQEKILQGGKEYEYFFNYG